MVARRERLLGGGGGLRLRGPTIGGRERCAQPPLVCVCARCAFLVHITFKSANPSGASESESSACMEILTADSVRKRRAWDSSTKYL